MSDVGVARGAQPSTRGKAMRGRLLLPILIAALVLSVLVAAALGVFVVRAQQPSAETVSAFLDQQRPAVERRAARVLTLIVNFDRTNIEQQREQLLAITTGTFREQYEEAFQSLGEGLKSVSVSSRGEIVEGPNVSFKSASEAIALASLTETIQSNEDPSGITFINEVKLTLVHTSDGGWKADRAEILSTSEM